MKFRNRANGHVEEKSAEGIFIFTFLFGGLYFIASGLWAPLLIWLIISASLYALMGPPATLLMLVVNLIYAILAGGMVRSSYLRKGWTEVTDAEQETMTNVAPPSFRKCPFCAEEIRAEAIKCKHCGSEVPAAA